MSLMSWFAPKKNKKGPRPSGPADTSGLSRMESTRPVNARHAEAEGQPANRKSERMHQRELLYGVVRECMVRAGVLSSSYKFKVLSLDSRGRQFLLMVDLARSQGGETARLAEIEAMIAQAAKLRHDIVVKAVYWRMNEHVAVGLAAPGQPPRAASRPMPLDSQPGALEALVPPAPVPAQARQAAPGRAPEPIDADEIAAFKQALADGTARPARAPVVHTFDGAVVQGPQSYTLLTGFEDTELPDPARRSPALSATQYGDLT